MKKTILHVIESLSIGGAEVLLNNSLKGISNNYRHVLIYLRPPATLLPDVNADKVYCLGYRGNNNLLVSILRMRRIIKNEQVNLIHTHHYWPTIIARFAKTKNVPLIFTVHSLLSHDAFNVNRLSLYLEKFSYRSDQHAIFVSRAALEDYDNYIGIKGQANVLPNFAGDNFFKPKYAVITTKQTDLYRLVAVGTLKRAKNFGYLIEVFKLLRDNKVYLDIIGEGPLRTELEYLIEKNDLFNVRLIGNSNKVYELLQNYDAFIMASTYEGMSLAVIEAMAVGLPCILSDIPSNREVAGDAALYFTLSSPGEVAPMLTQLFTQPALLNKLSEASKEQALKYHQCNYLQELEGIYNQYLLE